MNNTETLLRNWQNAVSRHSSLQSSVRSAETDERNTQNDLGKFLCPKDARDGEVFHIWVNGKCIGRHGDVLLKIERQSVNTYKITIREERKEE